MDIKPIKTELYLLPVKTRVPLKFGPETLTYVTVARVKMTVTNRKGETAIGWGETPLSVQWVWPSQQSYDSRHKALIDFTIILGRAWAEYNHAGHPINVGYHFQQDVLPGILESVNEYQDDNHKIPLLAALVCCSPYDIALHDAYGHMVGKPVYQTYNQEFMNDDLSKYLEPAQGSDVRFEGLFPDHFFADNAPDILPAWHLVGGLDPITTSDLTGSEPDDGYPILLEDWIKRDGLTCLKIKLKGNDSNWDYDRIAAVGQIAQANGVPWLTADFNCTVTDPQYVNSILDKLVLEHPRTYGMLLYVEQPFPYDLEHHRIDVHSVSARKPLFMDESAHDWKLIRLGRSLGWTGVALKTCKTQTGALLSLCWAKAHGMTLMVQDLTNPMLAQIPHVLLAKHAGTIMGVESNSMQFYPEASLVESQIHPGLYQRRNGSLDLRSIHGNGFGYRLAEISRVLPEPTCAYGEG